MRIAGATQAFENTVNLAADGYSTGSGFPANLYYVTVLTKRHNVLMVAIMNASSSTTANLVATIVKHDKGFF